MQLGHADGGGLAHVGVLVLEALAQGLAQVPAEAGWSEGDLGDNETWYALGDLVDADAAHGADSERTDQRIRVVAVLYT